jgi:hypothetical protein
MTSTTPTPLSPTCDVCGQGSTPLRAWAGLTLCPSCQDLQGILAASGACVCEACLGHAYDHREEQL